MTDDEKYNRIQIQVQSLLNAAASDYWLFVIKATDREAAIKTGSAIFQKEVVKILTWGMEQTASIENPGTDITIQVMKRYKINGLRLSNVLYRNARQVEVAATNVIKDHLKYFQDARKLAMELYEGFGFKPGSSEILQIAYPRLPRYMFNAVLENDVNGLLYQAAQARASGLQTDSLLASYLKILEGIKSGVGDDVLKKSIQTAIEFKSRYYAKRIAQTELHRTRTQQLAREYMADDDIQYVQIVLSRSHPRPDMCDVFAKQDRYSLGPGIYPTGKCPAPPFHPFCKCSLTPRWDLFGANAGKENKQSAAVLLSGTGYNEAVQIAGTSAGLAAIKKGMDYHTLFDSRVKYSEYELKTLADLIQ